MLPVYLYMELNRDVVFFPPGGGGQRLYSSFWVVQKDTPENNVFGV